MFAPPAPAMMRDEKQQREAAREGEEKVAGATRGEADQDHRTPSDAVGHPSPHRREEELHDRVDADHHPDRRAAGAVFARVKREERDDHPEADEIDENGEEQDREGRFLHDRRRSVPCRPMPPTSHRLVLFDIDGTLITDGGAAREAFADGAGGRLWFSTAMCAATISPAAPIRRSRR